MKILWSIFLITMFLYVVFLQINALNEIRNTEYRFKFFALRDKLAMLVCNGVLREDSWEYKHIINALNYHIFAVEKLSIVDVIEEVVAFHTSEREDRAVERFQEITSDGSVIKILDEYMRVAQMVIEKNSRFQVIFIVFAMRFARLFHISPSPRVKAAVVNPRPALSAIKRHRSAINYSCSNGLAMA